MTNFKLLSVAAILSTAIATPGMAQQAVQEPGLQALPELGCRMPIKRDSGRYGIDPQFVCERASQTLRAHVSEALRWRSQDVTGPQVDRSHPASSVLRRVRPTDPSVRG